MKLIIFTFALCINADEDLTHSWNYEKAENYTVKFKAIMPSKENYKNQAEAYDACKERNMNLATISTEEEHINIINNLKEFIDYPTVYWFALHRESRDLPFKWYYPEVKPIQG